MILVKFLILGVFTTLLFPPFFILPLGFLIFPFFYFHLKSINQSRSNLFYFINGLIYSLGFFSFYLIWIKNPFLVNELSQSYTYYSFLLIFIISFLFGVLFILFKYFRYLKHDIFLIPLFFTIFEMIIANLWHGFPWISFALIFSNNFIGSILLDLFGSYGAGFILINIFLIPVYILNYKNFINKFSKTIILSLTLILISLVSLVKYDFNLEKERNINVDLVQMNFPISSNSPTEKKYLEITNIIKESDAELIIFGENNLPFVVDDLKKIKLSKYLKLNQKIIIGATRKENNYYYNSLLFITNDYIDVFDKKILVPFGEFVPFRNLISFMNIIAGSMDFTSGAQSRYIQIDKETDFIPVICYEIIFFWKLINNKNFKSDLIVNITNDSWFGSYFGPYQHFYLSKMRSAEFNKPLIRVSNNGISAIFDKNGKILAKTKLNTKEILSFNLKLKKGKNLIFIHKILNLIIIIFFFFVLIVLFYKNARKHS